ncbi:acyl carrier protein [Mesomycoplasma hyorhinis]|uniref:acyl carrier protein n=1 Tax=Mesomycoplasma hyorhinis TaxID=2100 RepID=UPI003DA66039
MKKLIYDKLKSYSNKSIHDDSDIYSIGLDSLDFVELITELEEKYNIEITDEELLKAKTVKDVINLVESKVKK